MHYCTSFFNECKKSCFCKLEDEDIDASLCFPLADRWNFLQIMFWHVALNHSSMRTNAISKCCCKSWRRVWPKVNSTKTISTEETLITWTSAAGTLTQRERFSVCCLGNQGSARFSRIEVLVFDINAQLRWRNFCSK